MKTSTRVAIAIVVLLAAAAVAVVKIQQDAATPEPAPAAAPIDSSTPDSPEAAAPATGPLPRLMEVGSTTCVPCKAMEPVLAELRKEYAGRMEVMFVDVAKQSQLAELLGVTVIPVQIFYDADGKELDRHLGFFAKEDILAKWKEHGVAFPDKTAVGG